MSDESRRKPAVTLERPDRLRPSWRRRLARLAVVIGLGAVIIGRSSDDTHVDEKSDCDMAVNRVSARMLSATIAVQTCRRASQSDQDPATAVLLARALAADHELDEAGRIATQMLTTPARADALYALGMVAFIDSKFEDALNVLREARKLHDAALRKAISPHDIEHNARGLARDDGLLAFALTKRSEFEEALLRLDECFAEAERGHDAYMQYYCHTVAARTLIQVGYFSAAELEIDIATVLTIAGAAVQAAGDEQRADVAYQRGNLEQESGRHPTAITWFKTVLQSSQGSSEITRTIDTELNLAYSLAETGKFAESRHYLEEAKLADPDHTKQREWTWTAAQLAYRQHDLTSASSLIKKYFEPDDAGGVQAGAVADDPVDRDDRIDVASLQARIELERSDLQKAEQWAKRAVDEAERVRSAQTMLELRPWVLAKRRAPYELLFTALARSGQAEDAAMVFDAWQGRAMQDALATSRSLDSADRRTIAEQLTRLGPWLRVASHAAFARGPDRNAVRTTMQGIDLLALIVADGEVWRLTASHGPPQLSRLGAFPEIQDRVDDFRGHPTDGKRASELGALLVPEDAFRRTRNVLYVAIDGQLAALPVAALRRDGATLIERRPITRVLRLPEAPCVRASPSGHATVFANPGVDLPQVVTEGKAVAELLGTTSVIAGAATRAALLAAGHDAVLHVAAHTMIGLDGAAIAAADGEVSALEIAALPQAPSLVVLSACDTATSGDPESNESPPDDIARSLAAAFLAAGSQHVVATLRPVKDDGALVVSRRFYEAGGVADPARALARVQSAFAKQDKPADNPDWPYITVFGLDVCSEDTPAHHF